MTKICAAVMALCILPAGLYPQGAPEENARGIIQISSVRAKPQTLSCSTERQKAIVTVQAFFVLSGNERKEATALLDIYGYAADPPGNRLVVKVHRKRVRLEKSPAWARFEVECSPKSTPGYFVLAVRVDHAPAGLEVKTANPPEDGRVRISIVK